MSKTHWLYGAGPDKVLTFNDDIDVETDCTRCGHLEVCSRSMAKRCKNHVFGTSAGNEGCSSCTHRFTRFDNKQPVPCFTCDEFPPLANVRLNGGDGVHARGALAIARRTACQLAYDTYISGVTLRVDLWWQQDGDTWFRHATVCEDDGSARESDVIFSVSFHAGTADVASTGARPDEPRMPAVARG